MPTDVSPELQKLIAAPYNPVWNVLWKTSEEWRAAANAQAAHVTPTLVAMERLGVTVRSSAMNGVRVNVVTPNVIDSDQVLIHVHGGCRSASRPRAD